MKKAILAAAALSIASPLMAQLTLPRPSPKGSVMQTLGLTDVTVTYSRPGVKGRKVIWGEVVPYDKDWRTGANEPTTITLSDDVMVDGQKLAAGTYSIHTLPTKGDWTVFFNNNTKDVAHDATKDALKVTVKPQVSPAFHEWMTFVFEDLTPNDAPAVAPSSGFLTLYWEKLRLPIKLETAAGEKVAEKAKELVDDWRLPLRAATYMIDTKSHLDDAARWLDRSIALKETFANLSAKARLLAQQGKGTEAVKLGEKAIQVGKTVEPKPTEDAVKQLEKQIAEWKAKK